MSKSKPHKKINSSVVIAKLLAGEGFTPYVSNLVENYYRNRSGLTDRQKKEAVELHYAFGKAISQLSVGERLIVGKFIGFKNKACFDTGLRIGLSAFANREAQDIHIEGSYSLDALADLRVRAEETDKRAESIEERPKEES